MAISHRKEVTVLEAAEVRHGNPGVLVLLVGVRGRLARLCSERELRHAVGVHLARVGRVVGVLLLVCTGLLLRLWLLSALRQEGLRLALAAHLLVMGFLRLVSTGSASRHLHHLRVLRLRVGLHAAHARVLCRQWHLLRLNLVRLLHYRRLI